MASGLQWVVRTIFVLSTALNDLDRLLLAAFRSIRAGTDVLHAAAYLLARGGDVANGRGPTDAHARTGRRADQLQLLLVPGDFDQDLRHAHRLFRCAPRCFRVSILTASYGLMQTVLSPLIGAMVDHVGFAVVCVSLSAMPLFGIAILRTATR